MNKEEMKDRINMALTDPILQQGFEIIIKENAELEKENNRLSRKCECLTKNNEWHYVKDELPPENVPLNIITFDKDKKRRLWGR